MVFHLITHYIGGAAVYLLGDVFCQLRGCERLLLTTGIYEVGGFHAYDGIEFGARSDFLSYTSHVAYLPVAHLPVILIVGDGVILYLGGCKVGDEFLVFKLIETEAVAAFVDIIVVLHIGYYSFIYLQLNILGRGILLVVLIEGLEILANDGAVRNDVCGKSIIEQGDEYARNHVGLHETLEAYACCHNGYYLGVACHLGGKKDDGYEDK